LITKSFDDEVIVVDVSTQGVHVLSGPVAAVFGLCSDGRSVERIAQELGLAPGVVGEALVELERCGLLEDPPVGDGGWVGVMDRRGLLVRGAMLSVPLIASAVLPAAAAAGSAGSTPVLTEQASSSSGLANAISVAFSPDFNASTGAGLIAIASPGNSSVVVFSYTTGTLTMKASSSSGLSIPFSVAFSPDFNATTGAGLIAIADDGNSAVVVFSYV
jgi:DNA-binding transcriptional ArsR family regulator